SAQIWARQAKRRVVIKDVFIIHVFGDNSSNAIDAVFRLFPATSVVSRGPSRSRGLTAGGQPFLRHLTSPSGEGVAAAHRAGAGVQYPRTAWRAAAREAGGRDQCGKNRPG